MIDTMPLRMKGEACIEFLLLNVLYPYECPSLIQRYLIFSLITTVPTYFRPFASFGCIAGFADNCSYFTFLHGEKMD